MPVKLETIHKIMKKQPQLRYQTQRLPMTTSSLQSIVRNLGDRLRRMKVKLHFKDAPQQNAYNFSQHLHNEREDDADLDSLDSEDQKQEEAEQKEKAVNGEGKKTSHAKRLKENADIRQISVSFEMSILLREKYFQKLSKIGKRLDVRFMVVPEKVKIIGWKTDNVDQAEQEYSLIQDNVRFVPVSTSGRQIYQSAYYKNLLKEHKVELINILNKYYFWFQDDKTEPSEILQYVLTATIHTMMPLYKVYTSSFRRHQEVDSPDIVHGQGQKRGKRLQVFKELEIKIKATIFEMYVNNEIDRLEQRDGRKVELSQDRKNLIFHVDAVEQISIQTQRIEQLYEPFQYTYLLFNEDTQMQGVLKFFETYQNQGKGGFKKNKNNEIKSFFYQHIDRYVCFAIPNSDKDKNTEEPNLQDNEIMKLFKAMPEQMLNFKLVVQCLLQPSDQDPSFKKFSMQKQPFEKVTQIGLKQMTPHNYEMLFQCYIQQKFNQEYKYKKQELNNAKAQISQSVSIDMSRPVDESSMMFNDSMNNSLLRQEADRSILNKVLPAEFSNNNQPYFKFQDYNFCFEDKADEKDKRYSQKFDTTQKKSISYSNAQYQKALTNMTKAKFKIFKINIPLKHKAINLDSEVQKILSVHPEWSNFNRWVTVFYGGKEAKDYENIYSEDQNLKVLRIGDNMHVKEGYLLKTNVALMYAQFEEKKTVQLPYGQYEAMYFVKRLEL